MKRLCLLLLFSLTTHAQTWSIDSSQSHLQIISTKNASIAEVHHFSKFTGAYRTDDQTFNLVVDSRSLSTGIEIRDQRLQQFVLNSEVFSHFSIHGELDNAIFNEVLAGNSRKVTLHSTLTLFDKDYPLELTLTLAPLYHPQKKTYSAVSVRSATPVIIHAKQLGLSSGIDKLKELAKLNSIAYSLPVTFDFIITPSQAF